MNGAGVGKDDEVTGLILLMVLALGAAAVFGVALVVKTSNAEHERNGLFGYEIKDAHDRWTAIDRDLDAEVARAELEALAALVVVLDQAAHSGLPVTGIVPVEGGAWQVAFRDGSVVWVRAVDARSMHRANAMAAAGPLVVSRVHPSGTQAVVDLVSPRHAPLRVALRV